ncbi:MAG: carboxypeptidase regulatory-like domain-containing protein [Terriglobales bacterium]
MRRSRSGRLLLACFVLSALALAQLASGTLRGRIAEPSGTAIPGATITIAGRPGTARTNSQGAYALGDLPPGAYRVTASASGFISVTATVHVASSAPTTWNAVLTPSLSLSSLGFPASATQANAAEQARLNRRAHMLKIHQTLGVITTVPLAATVLTGFFAGGHATSSNIRNLHAALGISTAALYGLTAYYAIAAPKIAGEKEHGPIRLHEIMAWIHGPGMVLTPILGAMAYRQRSRGERVHGIAQLHGVVAITTVAAYTIAILAVTRHSGPPKPIRTAFNWMFRRHAPATALSSAVAPR